MSQRNERPPSKAGPAPGRLRVESDGFARWAARVIVFLPVFLTAVIVLSFAVDLPYQDQWDLLPALRHMQEGRLQWTDIYAQHNEALVLVPQTLSLLLAKVTRFNVQAEAYFSYICEVAAVVMLFLFFIRLQNAIAVPMIAFLPISLLFLSWRATETLLWGGSLVNRLEEVFALLAIWSCIRIPERLAFLFAAVAAALLATYSAASGLAVWPVGLAILLVLNRNGQCRRAIMIWAAFSAATIAVYLATLKPHPVPWPSGWRYVLLNPRASIQYCLTFAGSSLATSPEAASLIGSGMVVLSLAICWSLVRIRRRELQQAVLPFAAILLAVLIALAPAVMGRLGLGIDQPFNATRYVPLQALLMIGIYAAVLALGGYDRRWRWVGVSMAVLVCLGSVATYRQGLAAAREQFRSESACREILVHYRSRTDKEVQCYLPNPEMGRQRAFWLEQMHLSVFRNSESR